MSAISVIACCMNRRGNLLTAVRSWCQFKQITEIIILDYGSKPVLEARFFKDPRVQLWRVEADTWYCTKATNIAANLARGEILLKLDCDYVLQSTFFKQNILQPNTFIHGNKLSDELHGFLMLTAEDFWRVRGYNEEIVTYGYEDDDIKNRLLEMGLTLIPLANKTVYHLPHKKERGEELKELNARLSESAKKNEEIAERSTWARDGKPTGALAAGALKAL